MNNLAFRDYCDNQMEKHIQAHTECLINTSYWQTLAPVEKELSKKG